MNGHTFEAGMVQNKECQQLFQLPTIHLLSCNINILSCNIKVIFNIQYNCHFLCLKVISTLQKVTLKCNIITTTVLPMITACYFY